MRLFFWQDRRRSQGPSPSLITVRDGCAPFGWQAPLRTGRRDRGPMRSPLSFTRQEIPVTGPCTPGRIFSLKVLRAPFTQERSPLSRRGRSRVLFDSPLILFCRDRRTRTGRSCGFFWSGSRGIKWSFPLKQTTLPASASRRLNCPPNTVRGQASLGPSICTGSPAATMSALFTRCT